MIDVEWIGCFPACWGCQDNLHTELVIRTSSGEVIRKEVTPGNRNGLEGFFLKHERGDD